MKGGYPYESEKTDTAEAAARFNDNYKKLKTGGKQFSPDQIKAPVLPLSADQYGRDGYLNHMHINYRGGDDGESYNTGPNSDITFLDIINPLLLEGHN
jgi:hypothetical protein